ncbi:hypothetical protein LTR53_000147 [Teratosphaeriaceae sp. CCFEE 6253]|nr:hypothetical protein LTR53_000147 [Teratosphaeriaceae sp. CCFEE 6253]
MPSRTSSHAGDRLRRNKSTSSHHTASSGHQRSSTSTDPCAAKQHAEVAAVEAYNRAHRLDDRAHGPAPQLERRRRNTTGRVEGSHFEDARLGRRRSTSTKRESRGPQARRSQPQTVMENAGDHSGEERVVTRKRSVIPPSSATTQSQREHVYVPSTTSQRAHKSQSVYADGSPAPRRSIPLAQWSSTMQLDSTPVREHTDSHRDRLVQVSAFSDTTATTSDATSPKPATREMQTDEDILALARDRCLQDFQQKKVRERKSFILAPFQKRRATKSFPLSDGAYETSLPPFNYAHEAVHAPLPPAAAALPIVPVTITKWDQKPRKASETLKGRIKNVFRKSVRAPSGLPLQHVEARQVYCDTSEDAPLTVPHEAVDPFATFTQTTLTAAEAETTIDAGSRSSQGQCSETASRVTSWANSTTAGTCTSRAGADHAAPAKERAGLHRSNSVSTLRKAKSFFGNPGQNKLRRASKAELKGSEETQGLYSALQQRIRPAKRTPTPDGATVIDGQAGSRRSRVPSELLSLPSQQQAVSLSTRYSTPTIRNFMQRICSPVEEVLSPDVGMMTTTSSAQDYERTLLRRRPPTTAPAPSQEQLQRRMEKSKNRWQTPLDELSPHPARADMDENPYELRSLSQTHQQPQVQNDLPHHAKLPEQAHPLRRDMLSPSVYSRGDDGASPRPLTPVEAGGMVVTITGREVRSYSISPPKQEAAPRPSQTSGQWRRWLSDEMHGIKSAQEDFSLAQVFLDADAIPESRSTSGKGDDGDIDARQTSISPPPEVRSASMTNSARPQSATTGRPRTSSRRSSFMNERYPVVDTSRNSSTTIVVERKTYSRAGSSSEKVTGGLPGLESRGEKRASARPRVVTARASMAPMQSVPSNGLARASEDATRNLVMSGALPGDAEVAAAPDKEAIQPKPKPKKANRHRSAFELRANYNNTATGRSTPLEIHRKPIRDHHNSNNIMEDTTIRNISAGPYASHPLPSTVSAPTYTRDNNKENNKENTPPSEPSSLPACSSSEWLAAGPNKSRRPSTVHPALRNHHRAVSRYSPPKGTSTATTTTTTTTYQVGGRGEERGSPAQRMASQWLEKRSRKSTPAFI